MGYCPPSPASPVVFSLVMWLLLTITSGVFAQGTGNRGRSTSVRGNVRCDRTYVAPHCRTLPDKKLENGYSTWGNYNPYKGKEGIRGTPATYRRYNSPGHAPCPPIQFRS
jgi:hypothetical protein